MDESRKKVVLTSLAVMCLLLAVVIVIASMPESKGVESLSNKEIVTIKCSSKSCQHVYEMGKKQYYQIIEETTPPGALNPSPIECEKCGKKTGYKAIRCPECQTVFFRMARIGDFADRCPKCSFSQTEFERKNRDR